jgi:hypothetical protein
MNPILDDIEADTAQAIAAEAQAHGLSVNAYLKSLPARPNEVDRRSRGIEEVDACDLRARPTTFTEDWNRPEADIHDDDPPR